RPLDGWYWSCTGIPGLRSVQEDGSQAELPRVSARDPEPARDERSRQGEPDRAGPRGTPVQAQDDDPSGRQRSTVEDASFKAGDDLDGQSDRRKVRERESEPLVRFEPEGEVLAGPLIGAAGADLGRIEAEAMAVPESLFDVAGRDRGDGSRDGVQDDRRRE